MDLFNFSMKNPKPGILRYDLCKTQLMASLSLIFYKSKRHLEGILLTGAVVKNYLETLTI